MNERFTEEIRQSHWLNTACKIIIKGNLSNFDSRKTFHPHDIFYSNQSCDSNGNINNERYIKPQYKYAILNHYYTKSITEYVNKVKKGIPTGKYCLDESVLKRYFDLFFTLNNKTEEKVKIFNTALNTSFT